MAERAPSTAQVRNAARILANALMVEANRIRDEQGHNGHVAAQELEHDAIRIGSYASRIEAMRARRRDVQLESARRDPRGLGDGCGTN